MAFKVFAEGSKTVLYLYDVINEDYGAAPSKIVEAIDAVSAGGIEIRINSPGGDAWGGQAIYNALRASDVPSVAVIDGIAASAASMVAIGADEVRMKKGTNFMIHKAWTVTVGDDDDHERALKPLRSGNKFLAEAYAEKTGKTVDEMLDLMSAESWFSATESVEIGLADSLEESIGIAAYIPDPFRFQNTPKGLEIAAAIKPEWIPEIESNSEEWKQEHARRERLLALERLKMC